MTLSTDTKYAEAMSSIRHYSALRFAMLTIFVAITGGLLSTLSNTTQSDLNTVYSIDIIRVAGFWVSVSFFIFEVSLNIYLANLWSIADRCEGATSSGAHRSRCLKYSVRFASGSIPFFMGVFWAFQSCFKL